MLEPKACVTDVVTVGNTHVHTYDVRDVNQNHCLACHVWLKDPGAYPPVVTTDVAEVHRG